MSNPETPVKLPGYHDVHAGFDIEAAYAEFSGDLRKGINVCVECCDRHVGAQRLALRCLAPDETLTEYTFEDLRELSAKAANLFTDMGLAPGDVIAGLLPRTIELVAVVLGAWRMGAVYQPLFTAFGPKAIEQRLATSGARLVVTNTANRPKLEGIPDLPPVATVRAGAESLEVGDLDFRAGLHVAATEFAPVMRRGDDPFMMMFTSGTTGLPKGVSVPLRALPSITAYLRYAVDLREDDVFWNIADPGWAYGLYYAVCGPLLLGRATTLSEGPFTAESMYRIVEQLGVTSLAGSPTAFRLLIAAGPEHAKAIRGQLRVVSSAGEPLNPEVIRWVGDHLDAPIYDHYGQTEVGMCVNNHHGLAHPVRAGSAGLPMPGFRMVVLDDKGSELGPNQPGVLAVDVARSPLMWFTGYLDQETSPFDGGYYRTGDSVEFEPDGSVSFIGRADDVITSSGYRIGPFDVESALIEHPAVVEAAVIGVPDPERTEIVKAFVKLAPGADPTPELADELRQHVRTRLSAHSYPRLIDFVTELPTTPSGKLQRFVLRKAELDRLAREQS
ncbi:MAG: AMP-binding protein [Burkholderiaceae bacterium]